jgi:predicted methyltransferase
LSAFTLSAIANRLIRFAGLCLSALLLLGSPASTKAQTAYAIADALADSTRDVNHLLRDDARRPAEVIQFLGLTPGMRVLDLYAADGYYTYLLSRLVGDSGQVYAQNPPAGSNVEDIRQMYSLADALDERIELADLTNVTHLRESFFELSIAPASLDLIMLVQILHDFYNTDPDYAAALLAQLLTYLKPDGLVAIIDHAGDAGQDNARLHRMSRQQALDLAARLNLRVVGDSDLLANPRDRRRRPVFDPMLGRNTDRFLLKLQK